MTFRFKTAHAQKQYFLGFMLLSLFACSPEQNAQTSQSKVLNNTTQVAQQTNQAQNKRASQKTATKPKKEQKSAGDVYKTIEWLTLIPKEDLEALLNPPDYISDIKDGSSEDKISSQIQNTIAAASDDRYQQALISTKVVTAMNNKKIRIPGFIVPLEFDDQKKVTQFFLVPFFGACIHVPPPPPNQIIYVDYAKGLVQEDLYTPYWIQGKLSTDATIKNELGTAAYTLEMTAFEIYKE